MKQGRSQDSYSPQPRLQPREDPVARLRSTMARIEDRTSEIYTMRNSYSSNSLRMDYADFRMSSLHQNTPKKNSFQGLKATLDSLEDKLKNAKEELQLPGSNMKKKTKAFNLTQEEDIQQRKPSDSNITLKNSQKRVSLLINSKPKPRDFKPIYSSPYSPRKHSTYYVSQAVRAINQKNSMAIQHIGGSIRIIKSCEEYEIPSLSQIEERKLSLKKSQFYKNKKTLVLDLDETLIHCVENQAVESDMKLKFQVDEAEVTVGIKIRPYAMSFLKKMMNKFQIIIFTASHHSYADAILDELDPDGEIFQHRLYRQHCVVLGNEWHVKDLRILNRNLSEMVLVDNAAYSYAFQLQNGIPILPYYEGSDYELAALQSYLQQLQKAPDVRQINKKTFKLHHYSKFYSSEELVQQLYVNNFN